MKRSRLSARCGNSAPRRTVVTPFSAAATPRITSLDLDVKMLLPLERKTVVVPRTAYTERKTPSYPSSSFFMNYSHIISYRLPSRTVPRLCSSPPHAPPPINRLAPHTAPTCNIIFFSLLSLFSSLCCILHPSSHSSSSSFAHLTLTLPLYSTRRFSLTTTYVHAESINELVY